MSRKWSKEDRNAFNNSEVMREFEKNIIDRYNKLVEAQKKYEMNKEAQDTKTKIDGITEAVKGLSKEIEDLTGNAEDGELENNAETIDTVVVPSPEVESGTNEEISVTESKLEKAAKEETLLKLYNMARKAALEGNIKLAYKIERTISELSEE